MGRILLKMNKEGYYRAENYGYEWETDGETVSFCLNAPASPVCIKGPLIRWNKWIANRSFFGVCYLGRLVLVSLSMERSKQGLSRLYVG